MFQEITQQRNYIIPSDNWEQQHYLLFRLPLPYYIIPSDNWEQQPIVPYLSSPLYYIIPSDNWEQQRWQLCYIVHKIISYQAITGNNNPNGSYCASISIISYQAITGNNNPAAGSFPALSIISYQAITGNNNVRSAITLITALYHTKR